MLPPPLRLHPHLVHARHRARQEGIVSNFWYPNNTDSLKCDNVRVLFAPQYISLNLERIFEQAKLYPIVLAHLPEQKDWHRLPR